MKQNWTYKKLGEVVRIFDNLRKPVTKKDRKKGNYPYYGATGIQDYVDSYLFDGRYLLIGEDGAKWSAKEQSAFIIDGKSWVNNHAHVLKCDNELLDFFLVYYLNNKDLNEYISGAVVRKLTKANLIKIPIPVPPLEEQRMIVEELDLLQSIIDKKKRQLEELDTLQQSIFYDMFGDPITNEKNWQIKKLGEVCEYAKTRIKNEDVTVDNYVGVENMLQNRKGVIEANKVPEQGSMTSYEPGDILIGNIRPYLKKIWKADKQGGCNGDVLVLRLKNSFKSVYNTTFLLKKLSSDEFFEFDMHFSKGEKMPRGDKKMIMQFPIPLPPLALQKEFAEKVEAIECQKEMIKKSIADSEQLFAYTMDKYFG